MTRTVLITRPEEDALPLAETLRDRDLRVLIEPMLRIKPIRDVTIDLEGIQALLFTSSNGVRAFAALSKVRELPVFTTGEASARVARNLGFKTVDGADGDVSGLARLVRQRLKPADGALYHGAGSVVAGDLATQLSGLGYELRRDVIYEAVQADELSPQLLQKIENGEVDIVLLFSPRTAETFIDLLGAGAKGRPKLVEALGHITTLCLSPAVAEAARKVKWRNIEAATQPDLDSMLRLIERTTTALDAGDAAAPSAKAETAGSRSPAAASATPSPSATAATAPVASAGLSTSAGSTATTTSTTRARGDQSAAKPPRRRGRGLAIAAVIVVFAGLAIAATIPAWRSWTDDLLGGEDALSVENSGQQASTGSTTETESAQTAEALSSDEATTGGTASDSTATEAAAADSSATADTASDTTEASSDTSETPTVDTADASEDAASETTTDAAAETTAETTSDTEAETGGTTTGIGDVDDATLSALTARLEKIEATLASSSGAAPDESLSALDARIAALEQNGGPSSASDEITALNDRIASIEQLLIDFMTEVPAESLADVKTEVQRLVDENDNLRNRLATLTDRFEQIDTTAFMLAVGRLGNALNEGRPFEAELSTLRKLANADPALSSAIPALDSLQPFAADGAPSEIALTARFQQVARAIVQAAQRDGAGGAVGAEDEGWFDRLIGRVSDLVTVRPVGEDVEGDGPAARVARAEARLAAGDLASAVNEIEQLTGAPAEVAAAWLATAKARLAAGPAYRTLDTLALDRLGAGAGASGAANGAGG